MKTKLASNLIQRFTITIWLIAFALAVWNFKRFGSLMYLGMIMMLGTMPLALIYGRVYCGWLFRWEGCSQSHLPTAFAALASPSGIPHRRAVILFAAFSLLFPFPGACLTGGASPWAHPPRQMTMMANHHVRVLYPAGLLRPPLPHWFSRGPAEPGEPLRPLSPGGLFRLRQV